MSQRPRLVLIDGHALAYRAYFALLRRSFSTRDGRPTGAVFGFTKMMLEAIGNLKPACLAVTFDLPQPTFRHEAYDQYKAQRARMADDMISQMAPLRTIVDAFDIPIYELPGWEADDLIGTLARQAAEKGYEVLILTGDRDSFQLVTEHVKVILPSSGVGDLEAFGPEQVVTKMGVGPSQIADLKGLMGDASDNIPGVPGIGEKGAVKLLDEFKTFDNLYANLDQVKGKTQDKLRDNREIAYLSRQLATINCEAPVEFSEDRCHLTMPDLTKLTAVLEDLEFSGILRDLPRTLSSFQRQGATPQTPQHAGATLKAPELGGDAKPSLLAPTLFDGAGEAAPIVQVAKLLVLDVTIVDTPEKLADLKQILDLAPAFTYDVETTGLDPRQAALVGLALAVGGPAAADCRCFYVPIGHDDGPNLPWAAVRAAVAPAFDDPQKGKVAHNAKFDLEVLNAQGLDVAGAATTTFDTMLADYLVYSGRDSHGLKALAWEHLRYEMTEIKALIGSGAKQITMAQVPVAKAAPYACADVAVTTELRQFLAPKIPELNQERLMRDVELPLVPVLMAMENHGVKLDVPYLKDLSVRLGDRIAAIETEIHEHAGGPFNINSPKQLGVVLFEKLQLPVIKRTKTGASTDAEVLEELSTSHDIVRKILEYRQLGKLKSTYVDMLPTMVNPKTGRVHTNYNQTVAATGRLSSQDPNLQNIPVRTQLGREIRKAFLPSRPDRVILAADYSQIELRILAHVTKDPTFLQAFRDERDIHAVTASEIFNVPLEEVTSEQRRRAKTTNFGIIYGQGAFGLSKKLGIPRKEAEAFIDTFQSRYPGIRRYMIQTLASAKRDGYVETLSGRRRYIPEVNAGNRQIRDFGERMAINAPIQGTAADVIKIAMVKLFPKLDGLPCAMLLQVHDELVFEVDRDAVEALTAVVRETMEAAFPLDVPLRVDVHSGETWMEAK